MLVIGSLVSGSTLVSVLIVPRKGILALLVTSGSGVAAAIAGLFGIGVESGRLDTALISAIIGFLLFAIAYSSATLALPLLLRPHRTDPTAKTHVDPSVVPNGSPSGGVTVVVSCPVEPERYHPRAFARALAELEASDVPLPSWNARPMLFAAERARYSSAGSFSPGRLAVDAIAAALAEGLEGDDRVHTVRTAYGTWRPALDEVATEAAAAGSRGIVVVQLAAAESLLTDRARTRVDDLKLSGLAVPVVYTPPLWGSRPLADRLVDRVVARMDDTSPDRTGVCLVGHGQPEQWERSHPSWTEQETYFHQRIRAHLGDHGIPSSNIRLAWLDWTEPNVTDVVRHLAALGCTQVLVVPASMPVESLKTLVDLRQTVHFARVADTAGVQIMEAWGRDDVLVEELVRETRKALNELPVER